MGERANEGDSASDLKTMSKRQGEKKGLLKRYDTDGPPRKIARSCTKHCSDSHIEKSGDISDEGLEKSSPPTNPMMSDPIYRIMHTLPRSDFLEIVKCRFGPEECERAASYFDDSFMKNPLRHLRLQIGCDRSTGLYRFYSKIHRHWTTLRFLDLSRNDMDEDDVGTLVQILNLRGETPSGTSQMPLLEVLDLSYNRRIGNTGAVMLLHALHCNSVIRAVILKGISVDDTGAIGIASLLQRRPRPRVLDDEDVSSHESSSRCLSTFFLNLNENRIGAMGTTLLGKGLPAYVSLTISKQRPLRELKGHSP